MFLQEEVGVSIKHNYTDIECCQYSEELIRTAKGYGIKYVSQVQSHVAMCHYVVMECKCKTHALNSSEIRVFLQEMITSR